MVAMPHSAAWAAACDTTFERLSLASASFSWWLRYTTWLAVQHRLLPHTCSTSGSLLMLSAADAVSGWGRGWRVHPVQGARAHGPCLGCHVVRGRPCRWQQLPFRQAQTPCRDSTLCMPAKGWVWVCVIGRAARPPTGVPGARPHLHARHPCAGAQQPAACNLMGYGWVGGVWGVGEGRAGRGGGAGAQRQARATASQPDWLPIPFFPYGSQSASRRPGC
jgi:hypothetical protein